MNRAEMTMRSFRILVQSVILLRDPLTRFLSVKTCSLVQSRVCLLNPSIAPLGFYCRKTTSLGLLYPGLVETINSNGCSRWMGQWCRWRLVEGGTQLQTDYRRHDYRWEANAISRCKTTCKNHGCWAYMHRWMKQRTISMPFQSKSRNCLANNRLIISMYRIEGEVMV